MDGSEWEKARGESTNYVDEIKHTLNFYSYADRDDAAATHKELCKFLQAKLNKASENVHLADDFLRGPRGSDLERAMRMLRDDIDILTDEVTSSYIDWKSFRSNIIRDVISKDAQLIRKSESLVQATEMIREASLSKALAPMLQKTSEANEILKSMNYIFSDRERICR